jgi:hypothetical protein
MGNTPSALTNNGVFVMRKIISIFLGMIASIGLILGFLYALTADNSVSGTIGHSRSIEASFQKAIAFVENQKKVNGRLPTLDEFKSWSEKFPDQPFSPKGIRFIESSFPQEAIDKFGSPTSEAYLLAFWRGEWDEYYASWANKSTLQFDPRTYHVLGSGVADGAIVIILSALFLVMAIKLWSHKLM